MTESASPRIHVGLSLLVVALAGVLGIGVWTWQGARPREPGGEDRPLEGLKIFGTVPDFSLIERHGRRVLRADLRGKVWIANFIYTHCTETCPLQSARMARLQADLASETDIRLISITVDPDQDTPEVLAEYAARFGADDNRWLFLTGEKRAIYALALEGFHLSVADPEEAIPVPPEKRSPSDPSKARQSQPAYPRQAPGGAGKQMAFAMMARLLEVGPAVAHPGHPGKPFIHSSRFALVDRHARIRGYYQSDEEAALGRLRRDVKALLREAPQ